MSNEEFEAKIAGTNGEMTIYDGGNGVVISIQFDANSGLCIDLDAPALARTIAVLSSRLCAMLEKSVDPSGGSASSVDDELAGVAQVMRGHAPAYAYTDTQRSAWERAVELVERAAGMPGDKDRDAPDFIADLRAEVARARAKFPGNAHLNVALQEEVGELARAQLQREGVGRVWKEAVQVACVALRIAEEGDADLRDADAEALR